MTTPIPIPIPIPTLRRPPAMAFLKTLEGSYEQLLANETVVGRHPRADLMLDNLYVSGIHALVYWRHGAWRVKDLGSRNGTFVNGLRLEPGESERLYGGDRLAFGDRDVEWLLVDVALF